MTRSRADICKFFSDRRSAFLAEEVAPVFTKVDADATINRIEQKKLSLAPAGGEEKSGRC